MITYLKSLLRTHYNSICKIFFGPIVLEILIVLIFIGYYFFKFISVQESEMKETLSIFSNYVVAFGSLFLLIVTLSYVFLTHSLVKETRKAREAQEKPSISFRIIPDEISPNLLNFSIKNSGTGDAYDIKVSFDPDPPYNRTTLGNIFKSLSYLGAGEEIRFYFAHAPDYFNNTENIKQFVAKVTYYNHPFSRRPEYGNEFKKFNGEYGVNVEELKNLLFVGRKNSNDIAKEMEGIKEGLLLIGQKLVDLEQQKHVKLNEISETDE